MWASTLWAGKIYIEASPPERISGPSPLLHEAFRFFTMPCQSIRMDAASQTFEWNILLCNHQKDKISYVPLDPVADYVYLSDLNTRLRVGWKTLPDLNFKLKFQAQISSSNLNFKTKIFPILAGNPGFWEIDSKGRSNKIKNQ